MAQRLLPCTYSGGMAAVSAAAVRARRGSTRRYAHTVRAENVDFVDNLADFTAELILL